MTKHLLDLASFIPTPDLMTKLEWEGIDWFYDDPAESVLPTRLDLDEVRERIALAISDSVITFVREQTEAAAKDVLGDPLLVIGHIGPRLEKELELPTWWCTAMAKILAERMTPSLQKEILARREIPRLASRPEQSEPLLDLTEITLQRLNREKVGIFLAKLYGLVSAGDSDGAIQYFFEVGLLQNCDLILEMTKVTKLDAPVLVAMLLGTRNRKDEFPSRGAFAIRAKEQLLVLLPRQRVENLWLRIE